MDAAALSLSIDSSSVVKATDDLGKFSAAATKAGAASGNQAGSIAKLVAAAESMNSKLGSIVATLDKIAGASKAASVANDNMASSAAKVATAMAAADAHVVAYQAHIASLTPTLAGVSQGTQQLNSHVQLYQRNTATAAVSAGQQRAAMQQLGYQVGDVTASLASGANVMTVFAQQGGQVIQALGMMTNSTKGLLGFLGGPWGQVVMAAVTVAGLFATKLLETGDQADKAAKKIDGMTRSVNTLAAAQGRASLVDVGNAQAQVFLKQAELARINKQLETPQGNRDIAARVEQRNRRDAVQAELEEAQAVLKGTMMRIDAQKKLDALKSSSNAGRTSSSLARSTSTDTPKAPKYDPDMDPVIQRLKFQQELMDKVKQGAIELDDWQKVGSNTFKSTVDQMSRPMEEALARQQEALEANRQTAKSFFLDWIDGVRNGENVFTAFGNSVSKTLDRLIDKMIDQMLNQMLGLGDASGMGGLGGLGMAGGGFAGAIGGILGTFLGKGIESLFTSIFGNGGAFGSALPTFGGGTQGNLPGVLSYNALGGAYGMPERFANGGSFTNQIVTSPTLFRFAKGTKLGEMGEAGPEAIMPLTRGPNGKLGVQAHGLGGDAAPANHIRMGDVNNTFSFDGAIGMDGMMAAIRQGGEATYNQVKRELQSLLQQLDSDGTLV